jgi:hypothetical protein
LEAYELLLLLAFYGFCQPHILPGTEKKTC